MPLSEYEAQQQKKASDRLKRAVKEVLALLAASGHKVARRKGFSHILMVGDFQVAQFSTNYGKKHLSVKGPYGQSGTRNYPWSEKKGRHNYEKMAEAIGGWIEDYERRRSHQAKVEAQTAPNKEAVEAIHAMEGSTKDRLHGRGDAPFDVYAEQAGVKVSNSWRTRSNPAPWRALGEVMADEDTVHFKGDIPAAAFKALMEVLDDEDFRSLEFRSVLTAEQAVEFARHVYGKKGKKS